MWVGHSEDLEEEERPTETQRRKKGLVKKEAETEMKHFKQGRLRIARSHQKTARGKEVFFL